MTMLRVELLKHLACDPSGRSRWVFGFTRRLAFSAVPASHGPHRGCPEPRPGYAGGAPRQAVRDQGRWPTLLTIVAAALSAWAASWTVGGGSAVAVAIVCLPGRMISGEATIMRPDRDRRPERHAAHSAKPAALSLAGTHHDRG